MMILLDLPKVVIEPGRVLYLYWVIDQIRRMIVTILSVWVQIARPSAWTHS